MSIYFEKALENSLKLTRIAKDENNSWVPGWKDKKEAMMGGMDVFRADICRVEGGCVDYE
jgi:hypothetical protein